MRIYRVTAGRHTEASFATEADDAVALAVGRVANARWSLVRISSNPFEYFEFYWEAWRQCLADEEDLCVVEGDIVVRPTTFTDLVACNGHGNVYHSWGYPKTPGTLAGRGIGCVRYPIEVIRAAPKLCDEIVEFTAWPNSGDPRHWQRLDGRIHSVLQQRHGMVLCAHTPPLWHLNAESSNATQPPEDYPQWLREMAPSPPRDDLVD